MAEWPLTSKGGGAQDPHRYCNESNQAQRASEASKEPTAIMMFTGASGASASG
jgi:hypothetical protein